MIAIMRLRTFVHPVLCTGRQCGEQGSISVRFAPSTRFSSSW
jgi:hypothetical protein